MRNKIEIFLLVLISVFLFGCTVLPASEETGIGPKEYAEIRDIEATKKENESLKKDLSSFKEELEKIKKDYMEASRNNEDLISRLQDAETKLGILENEGVPEFYLEETDHNSIAEYLSRNKSLVEKDIKSIEIVDSPENGYIVFYTTGYGESLNKLFIWNEGEKSPISVEGGSFDRAAFDKSGSLTWINNDYLLIDSGNGEYKIIDSKNAKVNNVFYSMNDAYLIPGTASFILQNPDSGMFSIYDFINSKEQEIDLDYKNKKAYSSFGEDKGNNELIFSGDYYDENGTTYSVKAVINIDKFKEKYSTVTLEEAIEKAKNNTVEIESTESGEQDETVENKGTV